jgi:hypothetical protein
MQISADNRRTTNSNTAQVGEQHETLAPHMVMKHKIGPSNRWLSTLDA